MVFLAQRRLAMLFLLVGAAAGCAGSAKSSDPGVKRVFVTARGYAGNLGAVAGADQRCIDSAVDGGLGGSGVWKAWVSNTSEDAIDRIVEAGPWHLVDGTTVVFANKAAIGGGPAVGINLDENGDLATPAVWTGTLINGDRAIKHCGDWTIGTLNDTGMIGQANLTDSGWTQGPQLSCANEYHLYCFEQ